ncbi:MAG TPA: class I SAM-dependent methyltransferase [Candidatus Deferrimicrobium sp.]|nr:class I SAM-dependent methyltransferase [Candidatus Deferrimicrobium sp.]
MKSHQDAFGHGMFDWLNGIRGAEIIERDDGNFEVSGGPQAYFAEYKNWSPHEKKAIRYARGRVLDIGCGAGRCMLYLKRKGLDAVGIDTSPLAIKVCKKRGLQNVKQLSVAQVSSKLGIFDTILMYGGNFGLVRNPKTARWLLRKFYRMTSERARIVACSLDPYQAPAIEHLEYHKLNRQRGRMPGQVRVRLRYKKSASPWFDWLVVSKSEMADLLRGTGWHVRKAIDSERGPCYATIIEKTKK